MYKRQAPSHECGHKASVSCLFHNIGVTRAEAKAYIQSYLAKYHGVRASMHDIVEQARHTGFVNTLMGRSRYLPAMKNTTFNIPSGAERIALNTPIQGTAADNIKVAMVRVHRVLAEQKLQAKLVLQIHDELIVECQEDAAAQVREIVRQQKNGQHLNRTIQLEWLLSAGVIQVIICVVISLQMLMLQ